MTTVIQIDDCNEQAATLRDEFLGWQCRVRQLAMRQHDGRPDEAVMPQVFLSGADKPIGQIITVFCKKPAFSQIPEMQHIAKKTIDQAERRTKAIEFLSSSHYQGPNQFNDTLTATFAPGSSGAISICNAASVVLKFEAFGQRFSLLTHVSQLAENDRLYQATWWHNFLFNAGLSPQAVILAFTPDWTNSKAETV